MCHCHRSPDVVYQASKAKSSIKVNHTCTYEFNHERIWCVFDVLFVYLGTTNVSSVSNVNGQYVIKIIFFRNCDFVLFPVTACNSLIKI